MNLFTPDNLTGLKPIQMSIGLAVMTEVLPGIKTLRELKPGAGQHFSRRAVLHVNGSAGPVNSALAQFYR